LKLPLHSVFDVTDIPTKVLLRQGEKIAERENRCVAHLQLWRKCIGFDGFGRIYAVKRLVADKQENAGELARRRFDRFME